MALTTPVHSLGALFLEASAQPSGRRAAGSQALMQGVPAPLLSGGHSKEGRRLGFRQSSRTARLGRGAMGSGVGVLSWTFPGWRPREKLTRIYPWFSVLSSAGR